MIFVDSNIPMYLVGAPHPHKTDAKRWLEELVSGHERMVTDAEVLQEIFRRYVSIERPDAIQPAFDALLGVVDVGRLAEVLCEPLDKRREYRILSE